MRPGQKNRSRGRNGGGGGGMMPHHNRGPRPPHRSQTFESNGPSVKIRGNAYQVFERYVAMAREAQTSGDRVAAENLYQHAEHYYRIMNAQGEGQGQGQPRPTTPADNEMGGNDMGGDGQDDGQSRDDDGQGQAHVQSTQPPPAPPADEQPSYRDEQPPYERPPYEPPRSY